MPVNLSSRPGRWVGGILALLLVAVLVAAIWAGRMNSAQAQSPAKAQAPIKTQAPVPTQGSKGTGQLLDSKPVTIAGKDQNVMAVVNGDAITRTYLAEECRRRYGKEVLDGTINRYLISQECERQKIAVTEKDVDEEIGRMAQKFKLSSDRWLQLLQEERGFTPEEYRREVVWPMLAMRQLTAQKLTISKEELRQAFESEYGPRVRARLIATDLEAKAKEAHAKAVADPESFPALSKQYSRDAAIGSANGVVPPIRRHMNDKKFEEVAFALKPGQISNVVQVGDMYYIIKCEDIQPAVVIAGPDLPAVEKQLAERMKEHKLRTVAGDMFKEMQTRAKVENIMNNSARAKEFPGVAALVNGKPITLLQLGEECLARHGKEVLDGEINRRLLMQELTRKQKSVAQTDLDAEVARAAEMYGYIAADKKTPDVERWLNEVTKGDKSAVELYVRDAVWPTVALKKLVGDVKITDEDLKKGYESNYGEKVEVLAIVLHDQRQAHKVWEYARNNPNESFFAQLAEQYSVEPVSKSAGGKVPPIRKHSGQGELETVAFQLKPGELSPVIAAGNQFIIMRCQGRTPATKVSFAQVRDEIFKDLEEQKSRVAMTQKFDDLKEAAQVDNFLAGTTQMGRKTGMVRPASATADSPQGGSSVKPAIPTQPQPVGQPASAARPVPLRK